MLEEQFSATQSLKKFKKTVLAGAKHSGPGKMALRNESSVASNELKSPLHKSSGSTLLVKPAPKKLELQGQNMNRTSLGEKEQKDSPSKRDSTLGQLGPNKEPCVTMYADKGESIKTGLHIESEDNISRTKTFDKTKSLAKSPAANNGETS